MTAPTTLVAPWHVRMTGRDPTETHRAATPLELLFDLCFVVAVAQGAAALHHDLVEGQVTHGVVSYLLVFFAIWWPWVNFTWFASAYDTDDVLYRLVTFVQIAGLLVVAAGVPQAFELDFTTMVVGYVIMRIAFVTQWLRVAREDPTSRGTALRFAAGIALVQVGWVARLAIGPPWGFLAFGLLALLELSIPVWAERTGSRPTPWHPAHVAERYGLFTIIVLGECVLAATTAVQDALAAGGLSAALIGVAVGGLVLICALWWSYFKHAAAILGGTSMRLAFAWGYGHYVIFASLAALGAGLQVAADTTHGGTNLTPAAAALTVALPAALYLTAAGLLHAGPGQWRRMRPIAVADALILLAALMAPWIGVPWAVVLISLMVAGLVAVLVVGLQRERAPAGSEPSPAPLPH
jgi:low temperature requirement protein LtrA